MSATGPAGGMDATARQIPGQVRRQQEKNEREGQCQPLTLWQSRGRDTARWPVRPGIGLSEQAVEETSEPRTDLAPRKLSFSIFRCTL